MIERELNIRGKRIRFLIFSDPSSPDARLATITRVLDRVPDAHLRVIPTVIIMHHKPGGRDGGGTWAGHEWKSVFSGPAHERNTGIRFADLTAALGVHSGGLIGMSRDRWVGAQPVVTFMHEVGHMVHNQLGGLVPDRGSFADFPGMLPGRCQHGSDLVGRAVEAYARRYYAPSAIYHELPAGRTSGAVNAALIATLDRSGAYLRLTSVPR